MFIHKSIFNNESNDMKRINNYLNFLDKMNGQTYLKTEGVIFLRSEWKASVMMLVEETYTRGEL